MSYRQVLSVIFSKWKALILRLKELSLSIENAYLSVNRYANISRVLQDVLLFKYTKK